MPSFADALREQYDAGRWLTPEPRDVNVFTWKFKPFATANVAPARMQFFDTPADYQFPLEQAQRRPVRTTESTFTAGDAMLLLTTYECDTRAAARAFLLRVLGEFQGPKLDPADAGEIAFAAPDAISAVAVRGNLVLFARNGGPQLTSTLPLLRGIDERLTTEPKIEEPLDVKIERAADGGAPFPLGIARPHADDWVHILARGGEVQASEQGLQFVPTAREGKRITVAAVSADKVAGRTIDLQ